MPLPDLWLSALFFVTSLFIAIWLFLQGYVNIKTGKVSKFGGNAFFHFLDTRSWAKPNPNWDNPKRLRLTGILAIVTAFVFARIAIRIFIDFILPNLK